eukprot:Nitzschia sp. Nitz4//scaffold51_size120721//103888//105647//NITZ4_003746-RA/size120721-snap-gene-0.44-mRNA-1//-1//CDS//3329553919//3734//frame0
MSSESLRVSFDFNRQYESISQYELPPPEWAPLKFSDDKSKSKSSKSSMATAETTSCESDSYYYDDNEEDQDDEITLADRFFYALGFQKNPLATNANIRNTKASDMRLAMLSNFSTAYNIVCISMVLDIMQQTYPCTAQDKSVCSSALIAGMIMGQLVGGTLGDVLGRHMAMAVVMGLQIMGALATACSMDGTVSIYVFLAVWRFVLGLGCGGVYPLAATITAESGDGDKKEDKGKLVALTFSMQGVAYLVSPLLTAALVALFPNQYGFCWRFLLGFGAVPGLFLMILRLENHAHTGHTGNESDRRMQETIVLASAREVPVSVLEAIQLEENLVRKLMGTAGCWFLFDVLFYGNVLFQPVVLASAFGPSETILKSAIDTSMVSALALPGYLMSVITMGRQSPRLIQSQGFLVMACLYVFIGVFFDALADLQGLMITLYGSTFFFSNYGPNATTYVLPSMTFSRACRSTLNGISAAAGKAGALLGTIIFVTAASKFGQAAVMVACGVISLVGMIVTLFCVSETVGSSHQMDDKLQSPNLRLKVVLSEPSLVDYYQSA